MNDLNVVPKKIEIERRFKPTSDQWKELFYINDSVFIKQYYPEEIQEENLTVRIRITELYGQVKTIVYEQCKKGPKEHMSCTEDEGEIKEDEALRKIGSTSNHFYKWRHKISLGNNLVAEVDQITHIRGERCDSIIIIEVEFPSVKVAEAFTPLPWMGEEITGKHEYSGSSLARNGEPT